VARSAASPCATARRARRPRTPRCDHQFPLVSVVVGTDLSEVIVLSLPGQSGISQPRIALARGAAARALGRAACLPVVTAPGGFGWSRVLSVLLGHVDARQGECGNGKEGEQFDDEHAVMAEP
jgi:hypothetical protein